MITAMPKLPAWPLFFALVACDGAGALQDADGPDGGSDSGASPSLTGPPAPALSASPGYAAPPKLSMRVLAGRGNGAVVSPDTMLASLRVADAACLGETHDSFAVHSLQLLLLDRLRSAATTQDTAFGVGFEMFERRFQFAFDDLASGRIAEGTFRANSEYETRWGYPWELYQPLVAQALAHGHPLRALNIEREVVKRIAAVGVAALTADEKALLPELVLTSTAHRAWFRPQIEMGHGDLTDEAFERFYAAQVARDEAMAETAAMWQATVPGRRIAIVAGRGHCVDWAIPDRMRRRGVAKVASVQIMDESPGAVEAAVVADPADFIVGVTISP